jgi:hypothetical protein
MERSTGKTMDCFVELETEKDAKDTVDRINNRSYDLGSSPRIGNRHVDVELSSPAKMMKAIFPLAKCIAWVEGKPVRLENKDSWSTGFDGFLTDEELFCLLRHAEQPHRVSFTSLTAILTCMITNTSQSAFASKVPQRCYESFITTILKVSGSYSIHSCLYICILLTRFLLLHSSRGTHQICTLFITATSFSSL